MGGRWETEKIARRNNGQECAKFGKNCKPTYPRSSTKHELEKHEESYAKARHNLFAQNQ